MPKKPHESNGEFWPARRIQFEDPTGLLRFEEGRLVAPPGGWGAVVRKIEAGALDPYLNAGTPWRERRYKDAGPTLLYVAALSGAADVVRALLARGADPKLRGGLPAVRRRDSVPLEFRTVVAATSSGDAATLALFLDAGMSPDDGVPLETAIIKGHDACFDLLLARGADPTARGASESRSLWETATNHGRERMAAIIAERLRRNGAKDGPRTLRTVRRRVMSPPGPFSAFARRGWAARSSWVVFAFHGRIDGLAQAIGGGAVLEDVANKKVEGSDVAFLLSMNRSKWVWYLWRPALRRPMSLPADIEGLRSKAKDLSARTGRKVLVFRDANVERVSETKVTPVLEGRWPSYVYAEHGRRPRVSATQALKDLDSFCVEEGLDLPDLTIDRDGLDWFIELVNRPLEDVRRVDAIVTAGE